MGSEFGIFERFVVWFWESSLDLVDKSGFGRVQIFQILAWVRTSRRPISGCIGFLEGFKLDPSLAFLDEPGFEHEATKHHSARGSFTQ